MNDYDFQDFKDEEFEDFLKKNFRRKTKQMTGSTPVVIYRAKKPNVSVPRRDQPVRMSRRGFLAGIVAFFAAIFGR